MLERVNYPAGVPCWIDLVQDDYDRTAAFYGDLFGWSFEVRTPPEAPGTYAYARLDGAIVCGIGGAAPGVSEPRSWMQYVAVESVDETVRIAQQHGGSVVSAPVDIPRSGRVAVVADPDGAAIGVWQAAALAGAQVVNAPGSWNFSELHTADAQRAMEFYGPVFGWEFDRLDFGAAPTYLLRRPGYGHFLAANDPEIRERQAEAEAPDGFADAVAWIEPFAEGEADDTAWWSITFAVADADASFERAQSLGATVVTPLFDTDYTRQGTIRDPQGALLTLSEFRPPEAS